MDADHDLKYYNLMKAWKQNDNTSFNFYDAHDINNIYDKSEASIKAGLQERFRNTKVFVLLVGEHTKYGNVYFDSYAATIIRNLPVDPGYQYRVTCKHYAKKNILNTQTISNTSNIVTF